MTGPADRIQPADVDALAKKVEDALIYYSAGMIGGPRTAARLTVGKASLSVLRELARHNTERDRLANELAEAADTLLGYWEPPADRETKEYYFWEPPDGKITRRILSDFAEALARFRGIERPR